MSELATIARPYARAAFEIAESTAQVGQWSEFLTWLGQITLQPGIARFIDNPSVAAGTVATVLCDGFGIGLPRQQQNFIRLLALSRRLMAAVRIAELFADYRASAEQFVTVDITSARPLIDEQTAALQQALQRRFGYRVIVHLHTDAALLCGAIIRVGDLVIDGTFKSQLKKLAAQLAH